MPIQMNNLNFECQNIYAGFYVHLKDWKVTILSEEMMLKTFTMPPKPKVLSNYLLKNYPGASFYSAYEVGFCGLWANYQLCELDINNIVVNPADIPGTQKDKLQKEDKRDSSH
jgi:transposase